jgi:hypothetical protein
MKVELLSSVSPLKRVSTPMRSACGRLMQGPASVARN